MKRYGSRWRAGLVALTIVVVAAPAAAGFCPDAGTIYPSGDPPFTVVPCDVNGDGFADLITANADVDTVSVLLNDQSGSFGTPTIWPTGDEPVDVICCDVDGDGDQDLITANRTSDDVTVLINNGAAQFAAPISYAVDEAPWGIKCLHLDGNNRLDLVTSNFTGDSVSVLLNNGDGTFAAQVPYPTLGNGTFFVDTCDVDGDTDEDLVVSNLLSSDITVFRNNGDGTLTRIGLFTVGTTTFPWGITCCDVDGDGDADIATANGNNTITILLNNGFGEYGSATQFPGVVGPYKLDCCDLDADGDQDIVTANLGADDLGVFLNPGSGVFGAPFSLFVGANPGTAVCADLDQDADIDVITCLGSGGVMVFSNDCASACGDGIVDPGEACDDGVNNSDTTPDACRTDCTLPTCGDGVVDTGEQCDDGGKSAACNADCTVPGCTVDADCDDANACTDDICVGGVCQIINNTAACDDGNACTTNDACSGGGCVGGPASDCDDGNVCTTDSCDSVTGCVHSDNTVACNDGNACTTNDTCSGGGCVGGPPPDCDDLNVCTTDSCNPAIGCVSTNNTLSCDDGLFCTLTDVCSDGLCVGGGDPCPGQGCDEIANICFGCVFDVDCDDQNACTLDTCVGGICERTDVVGPCNDGNACTTNDACSEGVCVGGPAPDCNDGNVCTSDSCVPASGCVSTNNIASCNDGNACTTNDTCSNGVCVGGPPPICDDGNVCTDDSCDATDGCVYANNAAPCNDGNACTESDVCSGGVCLGGPPPDCDDGNVCTDDACDTITGCVHDSNTAPCDDGLFCTLTDVCSSGLCVGTGDPCPGQACDEPGNSCFGCILDAECDDLNACTFDECVGGNCQHTAVVGQCDDGNACTTDDTCSAGVCVGGPPPDCNDGNVCTNDSCNPTNGCVYANNTAPCNDGNACTTVDTCSGGGCAGGPPPNCDDANICTDDSCNPSTGCVHADNTALCADDLFCNGTETCFGGACQLGGDPCPTTVCDEVGNLCGPCQNDGACDDGVFCNGVELCSPALGCQVGAQPDCGDGVGCTIDFCHAVLDTCRFSPVDAICDNGLFCDGLEVCDAINDCQPGVAPCPLEECREPGFCGTCPPSAAPQAELIGGLPSTKNRFLSFDAGDPGRSQAIRVTIDSVAFPHHQYLVGSTWWVQQPAAFGEVASTPDAVPGQPNFRASTLGCLNPLTNFRDWNGVCVAGICEGGLNDGTCQGGVCIGGSNEGTACSTDAGCPGKLCTVTADCVGILNVYGEMIVPGASYTVSVVGEECDLNNPANFMDASLTMITSNYGDVAGICSAAGCTVPDGGPVAVADALAILAKFSGTPGAMRKARADTEPSLLDFKINVTDVLQSLRAFSGLIYPFLSCQPTAVQGSICFGGPTHLQSCITNVDCRVPLCP